MNKLMSSICFYLVLSILFSCKESDDTDPLLLPSGLELNVDVVDDGSGKVNIEATSLNANFYTIYFGESPNETPIKSNDGKASHTYSTSGDFIIRVQANATAAFFVEEEANVTIELTEPSENFIPTTGYTSPSSYDGLTLVWEDNFDGTTLNTSDWTYETGRGSNGWGNNELQFYRQENTSIVDGHLVISAKKENFSGAEYTSSRLITKDKKSFQYGRVDIRAALPKGQGIWPAFWMLGNNFPTVGWPKCGEIDIMEMVGGAGKDNTVYGTLHWDNNGSHACTCGDDGYTISNGTLAGEFHVYSIVWNANKITWYVNNIMHHEIDITPAELSEFDAPFFLIFNIAVGGNWPGNPNASTQFPQRLIVDYVRVFQ
jgi:beta-glucanase (GH16 family)